MISNDNYSRNFNAKLSNNMAYRTEHPVVV